MRVQCLLKNVDKKGAIIEHPDLLQSAFELGVNAVKNNKQGGNNNDK